MSAPLFSVTDARLGVSDGLFQGKGTWERSKTAINAASSKGGAPVKAETLSREGGGYPPGG
jgi:hypothetical protein